MALPRILVVLAISVWSTTVSRAAEPPQHPAAAVAEERLLQQFISSALHQKPSPTPPAESSPVDAATTALDSHATAQPALPSNHLPAAYSQATLKMVLALGATLGLLALAAYVCRRYLLKSPWFGKQGATLRVVARVNITPKAAVAIVEVPGKLLVIGVTGSSVTGLSELPVTPQPTAEVPQHPEAVSFVETLEQQMHHGNGHPPAEDPLLSLSERIQRKVSSLKQL